VTNLDYKRRTAASYVEVQTKFDKVNFIVGGRAEDYNITEKTDAAVLSPLNSSVSQCECTI
jgi:outer membrane receptor protein involved in Fe transport